ncbi:MAG: hypothetical protein MJZ66_06645 [Bacteroidales bacterium]|nr:hypothetical protein [Bacteroidales bacterium]
MEYLEILKYVTPSIVVLVCAYLILNKFMKREAEKDKLLLQQKQADMLIENRKQVLPVRMAAYERLVLLLERIEPQSILARTVESNMMAIELQKALLVTIRAEFEHNYSQQLYVSDSAWKAVKDTKEVIIQLINQSAQTVAIDAKASELGKRIIDNYASLKESPIDGAISILKQELASTV